MITRFRIAALSSLLTIFALAPMVLRAESFPTPGSRDHVSLLGIPIRVDAAITETRGNRTDVFVDGPHRLKVSSGNDPWDIRWFRVTSGVYSVDSVSNGDVDNTVDVPPDTIMISPFRIVFQLSDGETLIRLEDVDEQDRQQAAFRLARFVDFPEWQGREFIGFGSIRPSIDRAQTYYQAVITSVPENSEVFVDDRLAGTTPITLSLPGGKHKLLFRAEGREDTTRYVRLEGNADISEELPPAASDASSSGGGTYHTVIGPFLTRGEVNDQINNLFVDTLELTLENDPRLTIVRSDVPWLEQGNVAQPDFAYLGESGADLVVSGTFLKKGNQLAVQADLYDVQAETVKSGIFWSGDVGLNIFDAMDEIAATFMKEVDRVLPDAGRVLITQTETVYSALSEKDKRISRKQIIEQRLEEYPDSLSILAGFGGTTTSVFNGISSIKYNLNIDWGRDLSPLWQIGTGLYFIFRPEDLSAGTLAAPYLDLAANGGIRAVFRSPRADMSLGLFGSVQYTPKVYNDRDTFWYGSFLSLNLPIEFRLAYYFSDSLNSNPIFFTTKLAISFAGYQFDLSGNSNGGFVSVDGCLSVGFGVKL